MKVLKFGGTSLGNASRMGDVLDIITRKKEPKIIVLSAMSGTTNDLVVLSNFIKAGNKEDAFAQVLRISKKYESVIENLSLTSRNKSSCQDFIKEVVTQLYSLSDAPYTIANERIILSKGELISTRLFQELAQSRGVSSVLLSALDFMRTDDKSEPHLELINELLVSTLDKHKEHSLFITQGYISKNAYGEIDNLKRGGSDYTATIIGSVLGSEEVQIWTDIDGLHNNDPRIVDNTSPISHLSYREAAELAYFGAKILHPTCVLPAENAGVSIRLKCTMRPEADGTLISSVTSARPITALAAKDGITAIKIYSHRMLMAYGFLRKVFEVFEDHQTSVDMITTSEVAVSLTIDDITNLEAIKNELQKLGEVDIEKEQAIVCIVGNALYDNQGYLERIFETIGDIPIRMVSMGGSKYNISLLVRANLKNQLLLRLNSLFVQ